VRVALEQLAKLDAAAVGISPDPPARQKKFEEKHGLGFPLLSDPERETAKAYGAWAEKNMYGKKVWGILRSAFLIGTNGKIKGAFYKVKPEDTVPRALELLG
jgi:peroxiredoxin Q/BCP